MKICIDTRSPGLTAIHEYSAKLLRNLMKFDQKNEYMVLTDGRHGRWGFERFDERVIFSANPLQWIVWSNTTLLKMLKNEKVDVYHSLKHIFVFLNNNKKVITFHGSGCVCLFPELYSWYNLMYWRTMYRVAARKYSRIIVVSEAEKRYCIEYLGIPENKISTIYLAADKVFRVIEDRTKLLKVKEKLNLPDRFILYLGRILPVKNIEAIVKAYHSIKKMDKIEHKLVIVGKKSEFYYKRILPLVKELEIVNDVIFTDHITNEQRPYVYNLADLFLLPSHYEGFGIVLLEAMGSGVPVIASNVGGIPEAVGDAGILVSPDNVDEIADAIIQILSSGELRQSMIKRGLERCRLFSWERCARETIKVYEEIDRI